MGESTKDKSERMVEENKKRSKEKVEVAVRTIKQMLCADEKVMVSELVKKTGLSRAFFYNNPMVRQELNRAFDLQEGKNFTVQRGAIFDKALEKENELLKKKIKEQERQITELKELVNKLEKTAKNNIIKTLHQL